MDNISLIILLIGIVMVTVGAFIVFFRKKRKKRCSCKVIGILTDSQHFHAYGDGSAQNFGVYEYQYQGQTYYKTSLVGTTGRPQAGKKKTLYINPDNPQDCIIDAWGSALGAGVFFLIGFAFIVVSVVLITIG